MIISECDRYRGPELHLQPAVHHHRGGDRGAAAQLQPRGGLRLLLPAEEEALDQDQGGGGAAPAPETGGAAAAAAAPPAGSRGSGCHVPRSLRQDRHQVLQLQVSSSVSSNHRHYCHCNIFYVLSQFFGDFALSWDFHVKIGTKISRICFPAESLVVVLNVIFILMFRFTDNPTLAGMAAGRHQGHSQ